MFFRMRRWVDSTVDGTRWPSGLNFINILRPVFTLVDCKSVKRHWWLNYIFLRFLDLWATKAVRRMLIKLTPGALMSRSNIEILTCWNNIFIIIYLRAFMVNDYCLNDRVCIIRVINYSFSLQLASKVVKTKSIYQRRFKTIESPKQDLIERSITKVLIYLFSFFPYV